MVRDSRKRDSSGLCGQTAPRRGSGSRPCRGWRATGYGASCWPPSEKCPRRELLDFSRRQEAPSGTAGTHTKLLCCNGFADAGMRVVPTDEYSPPISIMARSGHHARIQSLMSAGAHPTRGQDHDHQQQEVRDDRFPRPGGDDHLDRWRGCQRPRVRPGLERTDHQDRPRALRSDGRERATGRVQHRPDRSKPRPTLPHACGLAASLRSIRREGCRSLTSKALHASPCQIRG